MIIMSFNLVLLWNLEFFEKRQNDMNFGKFWDWCELAYDAYMHMLLWPYVSSMCAWLRCLNLFGLFR